MTTPPYLPPGEFMDYAQLPSGLVVPRDIADEELRRRIRPTCVDLFAGCGGFSLGMIRGSTPCSGEGKNMNRLPYVASTVEVGRSQQRIMAMFRKFKVDNFSFHEKPGAGEFIVQFQYKGLPVSLPFSSEGALNAYLAANPWSPRRRCSRDQHKKNLRDQANRSIYRLAEDWLKTTFCAIEFGLISFEEAFLGSFYDQQSGKRLADVMVPKLQEYVGGRLALKGRE